MPVVVESEYKVFNPVMDRHLGRYWMGCDVAYRDIHKGEEMLDNYLFLHTEPDGWDDFVDDLKRWCSGEAGTVIQLENGREK